MIRNVRTKRGYSNENGATVVEFAVIVLLLLLISFGILEFAFIFYQRHFIENAAREGMRIGIRADNYSCFDGGCPETLDRKKVVQAAVENYLSTLYPGYEMPNVCDEDTDPDNCVIKGGDNTQKTLTVNIQVDNFFPKLLSGFIPGMNLQTLNYSITGTYEDPTEN